MKKQYNIYSLCPKVLVTALFLFVYFNSAYTQTHRWLNHIKGNDETFQYGIEIDQAKNLYLAGRVRGYCDFQAGEGIEIVGAPAYYRYYIVKYDPDGQIIWSYFPDEYEYSYTEHFAIDEAHDAVYVYGTQHQQGFIAKHSLTTGEFEWLKRLKPKFSSVGATDLHKIYTTPNGDIVFTGYTARTIDFDPGPDNLYLNESKAPFIAAWSQDGEYLWSHKLVQDDDNRVLGNPQLYFSPQNEMIWTASFEGNLNFRTGGDEYLLSAKGEQDVFMSYYDLNGLWIKTDQLSSATNDNAKDAIRSLDYDSQDHLHIILPTGGNMVLNPTTDSIILDAGIGYAVLRLDDDWNILDRLNIDGFFNYKQVGKIKIHPNDSWSIYLSVQESADLNPHPTIEYIADSPNYYTKEYFIARYNNQFELEHVFEPYTFITNMCWDDDINFYGTIHDRRLEYNINGVEVVLKPDQPHFFDTYVFSETKGESIILSNETPKEQTIQIRPNPVQSNSKVEIHFPTQLTQKVSATINHVSGEHIESYDLLIENGIGYLQLDSMPSGVYIINIAELNLSFKLMVV